jgi:hypothetical protein
LRSPGTTRRGRRDSGPFFEARTYPLTLVVDGEWVAGPFCRNCGNPLSLHESDSRCVPSAHWLFPRPRFERSRATDPLPPLRD